MIKKTIFYFFSIFCSLTLLVWGKRKTSQVFLAPWSRSRLKKTRSRLGRNQEPELLEKKGAGAAKKFAGSPALLQTAYLI